MRQLTLEGCTYTLHDEVDVDALLATELEPTPAPPPLSDDQPRFPKGAGPGDRVSFRDDREGCMRDGVVLDRAPQGVGWRRPGHPYADRDDYLASGYWLWVRADGGDYVRVRYWSRGRRKGQARRDDGPYVVESILGPARVIDHRSQQDVPTC